MKRMVVFEFESESPLMVCDIRVALDEKALRFDMTNRGSGRLTVRAAPIALEPQGPAAVTAPSQGLSHVRPFFTLGIALLVFLMAGCVNGERVVEVRADADVWMPVVDGVTPDGVKTCSGVVLALESNVPVGVFEGGRALGSGAGARVTLQADAPHELEIRRQGCEPVRVTVRPVTSGGRVAWFVVQCVLFPPALVRLPFALGCGEFNEFEPGAVRVKLRPVGIR